MKVDYYYRPEAETVIWQYIHPMEALLRHPGSETVRNMMFESRVRHVRHVEEVSEMSWRIIVAYVDLCSSRMT